MFKRGYTGNSFSDNWCTSVIVQMFRKCSEIVCMKIASEQLVSAPEKQVQVCKCGESECLDQHMYRSLRTRCAGSKFSENW